MPAPVSFAEIGAHYAVNLVILVMRYALFAGVAYLVFWVWRRAQWQPRRIQPSFPERQHLRTEIVYSGLSCLIFAAVGAGLFVARKHGYSLLYTDVSRYGWPYLVLSVVVAIGAHDAYFYWTHRFMHLPVVFRYVHRVHHLSRNPSPWAAFSFHPLEAVIEAAIVPLLAFVLPLHPLALGGFMLYQMGMNVLGHLGYEPYPRWFLQTRFGRLHNTSTHHNMHHQYVRHNFGLYFNWWDRLMGTNHPRYEERFEQAAGGLPAKEKQLA
ncbi:sterol desaturase family protein [Hymenobacter sp. 15J16-1T3B]|uniref:sterol desaturase family protein n=1 Tax=Hymenobacter sp. 15J16-1T3B TaxID=2886941 RepID=UPI001D0F9907|nr:sterol desaturase family protein [Hymenobacter sp. 15J16-1T3B]MCC3160054.1 sterol desaturase family protein [Hymenobacter sp. 15J16-1T3B]